MSDERWLSKEKRNRIEAPVAFKLHAEAADELIAGLADRLRVKTHISDAMNCDCNPCVIDRALLSRVDSLTKDTA